MKKPEPLRAEQLVHKNKVAQRSSFNGDKIRNTEAQGFDARRRSSGLSVVEGTRQPDPAKVKHRPLARGPVKPTEVPPLTDRQKKMLR